MLAGLTARAPLPEKRVLGRVAKMPLRLQNGADSDDVNSAINGLTPPNGIRGLLAFRRILLNLFKMDFTTGMALSGRGSTQKRSSSGIAGLQNQAPKKLKQNGVAVKKSLKFSNAKGNLVEIHYLLNTKFH